MNNEVKFKKTKTNNKTCFYIKDCDYIKMKSI